MSSIPAKTPTSSRVEIAEIMEPNDANFLGKIFGGKVLSLIDLCAYAASRKFSGRVSVTASFDRVDFHEPINVGELVTLVGYVSYAGRTSMEVTIEVYADDLMSGHQRHTNTARVTMVALDPNNKPTPVPKLICETREEKVRFLEGKLSRELRSLQRAERDRIAQKFRQASDEELDRLMGVESLVHA